MAITSTHIDERPLNVVSAAERLRSGNEWSASSWLTGRWSSSGRSAPEVPAVRAGRVPGRWHHATRPAVYCRIPLVSQGVQWPHRLG